MAEELIDVSSVTDKKYVEGVAKAFPSMSLDTFKPPSDLGHTVDYRYTPSYAAYHMPAILTDGLPKDIGAEVEEARREVANEDPVGVVEERYTGRVPVQIDDSESYAGITNVDAYSGDPVATRVGISNRVRRKHAKRVTKHELRHVRAEKMLRYADVPQPFVTLIMEAYAEYGGIKAAKKAGNTTEIHEILRTTPYPEAIQFGVNVDRSYVSDRDGKRGFAAFVRDIYRNRSIAKTLGRLVECRSIPYKAV